MNLGKTLTDGHAPLRVGLAVADAGLDIANSAVGRARSGPGSVAQMLGIDDAVERANRLARLMDKDQPLGRRWRRTARWTGCCSRADWWTS